MPKKVNALVKLPLVFEIPDNTTDEEVVRTVLSKLYESLQTMSPQFEWQDGEIDVEIEDA